METKRLEKTHDNPHVNIIDMVHHQSIRSSYKNNNKFIYFAKEMAIIIELSVYIYLQT